MGPLVKTAARKKAFSRAALLPVLVLLASGLAAGTPRMTGAAAKPRTEPVFGRANLARVHALLSSFRAGGETDDYYFALIGDIQNGVRSFRRHVFESIAADMQRLTDEETGAPLYDRIKFVILLGDLVYEGPSPKQWDYLERAMAGQDPDGHGYPNIKKLAEDKPIFPVLGNHDIFDFSFARQTRFRDYCDSEEGVRNFKRFFHWDDLIHSPDILYPVPADLSNADFGAILGKLTSAVDRDRLAHSYSPAPNGRVKLNIFDGPPFDPAAFKDRADQLAVGLSAIFRKAGYGTLPAISSDNMVLYAFEAGGVLYVMLDSMARGWHYPVFSGLKEALYPRREDRHRLNLFTKSPFNGQAAFYEAAAAYARDRGLSVVPMMHHSAFNNSRPPTSPGTAYNTWLALGLPIVAGDPGTNTIFDDIIFSDITHTFSACVHGYESFEIMTRDPGRPERSLSWTVSGGGGGPMRVKYYEYRLKLLEDAYNAKLGRAASGPTGRSIEIRDDTTGIGHEYLIVHVKGGRIVEVRPRFLHGKDLLKPRAKPSLTVSAAATPGPVGGMAALEFTPGVWGLEGMFGFLAFANWKPTAGVGVLASDPGGDGPMALSLSLSPIKIEAHIPGSSILTIEPAALEIWLADGGARRGFIRTGIEMPLFFNISGRLDRIEFGLKLLFPFGIGGTDPDFARKTAVRLSVGYRFGF